MFNVVRNGSIPISLADRRKYDSKDVWQALEKIFHKKCYICETNEPLGINVEHFVPHKGDEGLKFDWNNLYFSCARCNNIKLAHYDDLLDCCDSHTDVVRAIKHLPPLSPRGGNLQITAQSTDPKTQQTADLLCKVFNSAHTINKAIMSAYLRKKVFEQYNLLYIQMYKYYDPVSLPIEKETAIERIKLLLKPSSPYSAFISWCIIEDQELGPMLQDFVGMAE